MVNPASFTACERVLTALVFRYLCRGWHITHHPYDASKSKKKKKGEIAFQHTFYLLDGGWGNGQDHWLGGVGFCRRVTPDGISVALHVVLTALSVL
jgi:hypothetical protein